VKVLVFIDHDIVCRNFVMSGGLLKLPHHCDVRFVFPDDGGKRVTLDPATLPLGAPFERLTIDAERQRTWRWLLFADQLKLRTGAHEAAIRRLRWRTLGWKAAAMLTVAGLPSIDGAWQKIVRRRLAQRPNRHLPALLDREKPDVVFHPSVLEGVFINDLIEAASAHGIPTVVCMNSWDNPSTKRAVVGKPDWLLVWGEQTRAHSVRFMGMDRERVIPFGAAQFDVYGRAPRLDRSEFCRKLEIEPSRRIVLFAGSNAGTDEYGTLRALDRAISEGKIANTAIVYRPHPWGGGGRGGWQLADAVFRHVVIDPTMHGYVEALGRGEPGITLPDYRDTHDILSAVDAVVSPMSTILFEAVLHGKPPIVFAPADEGGWDPLSNGLPMEHFSEFFSLRDNRIARDEVALVREMQSLLAPGVCEQRGRRLRAEAGAFLATFDTPWSERIVEFLQGVATTADDLASSRCEASVA